MDKQNSKGSNNSRLHPFVILQHGLEVKKQIQDQVFKLIAILKKREHDLCLEVDQLCLELLYEAEESEKTVTPVVNDPNSKVDVTRQYLKKQELLTTKLVFNGSFKNSQYLLESYGHLQKIDVSNPVTRIPPRKTMLSGGRILKNWGECSLQTLLSGGGILKNWGEGSPYENFDSVADYPMVQRKLEMKPQHLIKIPMKTKAPGFELRGPLAEILKNEAQRKSEEKVYLVKESDKTKLTGVEKKATPAEPLKNEGINCEKTENENLEGLDLDPRELRMFQMFEKEQQKLLKKEREEAIVEYEKRFNQMVLKKEDEAIAEYKKMQSQMMGDIVTKNTIPSLEELCAEFRNKNPNSDNRITASKIPTDNFSYIKEICQNTDIFAVCANAIKNKNEWLANDIWRQVTETPTEGKVQTSSQDSFSALVNPQSSNESPAEMVGGDVPLNTIKACFGEYLKKDDLEIWLSSNRSIGDDGSQSDSTCEDFEICTASADCNTNKIDLTDEMIDSFCMIPPENRRKTGKIVATAYET